MNDNLGASNDDINEDKMPLPYFEPPVNMVDVYRSHALAMLKIAAQHLAEAENVLREVQQMKADAVNISKSAAEPKG